MLPERLRRLIPSRDQLTSSRWLRWMGPVLHHPRLWHWSRRGVAMGVGLGVFFGLLIPVAQIPLSAAAAVILRANVPAAAASTLVTNPVTFAPIYYAAYSLGAWVTGESTVEKPAVPAADSEAADERGLWERIGAIGAPLFIGLAITATIAGLLAYALISLGWYLNVHRKRRERRKRQRA